MIKSFVIVAILLFTSAGCMNNNLAGIKTKQLNSSQVYNEKISVGKAGLWVEPVTDEAKMEQGLSGRTALQDNQGMLFDYGPGASLVPAFWMKEMKFNLDFIWIKNNRVVEITKNVAAPSSPEEQLKLYSPKQSIDSVLEVNAGWSERNRIQINDTITK